MNLEFENLAEWGKLRRKISNQRSYFYTKSSEDEVAGWKLQLFTLDKAAKEESVRNLAQMKQKARETESPVLIVKGNNVQFVGTELALATTDLVDQEWMDRVSNLFENKNYYYSKPFWTQHENDHGRTAYSLYAYGSDTMWARHPHTGFYLINEDRRITDRREQIQLLWNLGWVSRRGRPMSIGWERHSGSTDEIALITQLAKKMWSRRGSSEVADKIYSTYNSINRYYAWPGNW